MLTEICDNDESAGLSRVKAWSKFTWPLHDSYLFRIRHRYISFERLFHASELEYSFQVRVIHTWCGIGPYFDFIIVTINSKNVHFYQLNELCKVCSLQPTLPTLLWKVCFVRLLMLGSHDVTLTTTKCIRCKRDAAVEQPLTRAAHQLHRRRLWESKVNPSSNVDQVLVYYPI